MLILLFPHLNILTSRTIPVLPVWSLLDVLIGKQRDVNGTHLSAPRCSSCLTVLQCNSTYPNRHLKMQLNPRHRPQAPYPSSRTGAFDASSLHHQDRKRAEYFPIIIIVIEAETDAFFNPSNNRPHWPPATPSAHFQFWHHCASPLLQSYRRLARLPVSAVPPGTVLYSYSTPPPGSELVQRAWNPAKRIGRVGRAIAQKKAN